MRMRLALLVVLVSTACGGSDPVAPTPTATPTPAPITPASLHALDTLQFTDCGLVGACTYKGQVTNRGLGCASGVRGVTTLYTSEAVKIDTASWAYTPVVRPSEVIVYGGCCLRPGTTTGGYYVTDLAWDDIRC